MPQKMKWTGLEPLAMVYSLPETRVASPHSDIDIGFNEDKIRTGRNRLNTENPRNNKNENEAMILGVPTNITSPVAIKKIYSDTDITYNIDIDSGRLEEGALHQYHQQEHTIPEQQVEPHYQQCSYHTL